MKASLQTLHRPIELGKWSRDSRYSHVVRVDVSVLASELMRDTAWHLRSQEPRRPDLVGNCWISVIEEWVHLVNWCRRVKKWCHQVRLCRARRLTQLEIETFLLTLRSAHQYSFRLTGRLLKFLIQSRRGKTLDRTHLVWLLRRLREHFAHLRVKEMRMRKTLTCNLWIRKNLWN